MTVKRMVACRFLLASAVPVARELFGRAGCSEVDVRDFAALVYQSTGMLSCDVALSSFHFVLEERGGFYLRRGEFF